ncbi:MAG: hypothetical protein NW204_02750 [Xanthomonadaceae bacterium]|nr:hypothetical protein [Xanthomonadaceae bacterium]
MSSTGFDFEQKVTKKRQKTKNEKPGVTISPPLSIGHSFPVRCASSEVMNPAAKNAAKNGVRSSIVASMAFRLMQQS